MKKERIPVRFLYTLITGAIGKEFVIKHYKYGTVKTKYPDMSRIIASKAQRSCRDKFRDAVAYAKSVMADPVQKEAWRKKVRIKSKLFVMIVRHYLLELKEAAIRRNNATKRLILACFNGSDSIFERSGLVTAYPDNVSSEFYTRISAIGMYGAGRARIPTTSSKRIHDCKSITNKCAT